MYIINNMLTTSLCNKYITYSCGIFLEFVMAQNFVIAFGLHFFTFLLVVGVGGKFTTNRKLAAFLMPNISRVVHGPLKIWTEHSPQYHFLKLQLKEA